MTEEIQTETETSCFWLPSEFFTEDDFLPEKHNKNSTSPQSTLSHYRSWAGSSNTSPQGVHSPISGNQNDAVRDLIHKAANQVATLNLGHNNFVGPRNNSSPFLQNSHFQRSEMVMGQVGWAGQQDPTRFVAGSGSMKRKCVGTGVFLPRINNRVTSNTSYISDSRKKPGSSFGLVLDRTGNYVYSQSQPVSQPQFNLGYIQNYESLIARRNSIMAQRRALLIAERSLMMNCDMYLPQEWTY